MKYKTSPLPVPRGTGKESGSGGIEGVHAHNVQKPIFDVNPSTSYSTSNSNSSSINITHSQKQSKSSTDPLASALSRAPNLKIVRTVLPAVWNGFLEEVSRNKRIERVELFDAVWPGPEGTKYQDGLRGVSGGCGGEGMRFTVSESESYIGNSNPYGGATAFGASGVAYGGRYGIGRGKE